MKSVIVYYSFSGNTKKAAEALSEYLRGKSDVEIIELKAIEESSKFLIQGFRALMRKRTELKPVNFDLGSYDLICLGTPVWSFAPTPAINAFLDKCFGTEGKQIVLFTTYGSGTGNNRCLNYMQRILTRKGALNFRRFSIQQGNVADKEFVLSKIKEILPLSPNG